MMREMRLGMQFHLKTFTQIFRENWDNYLELACLENSQGGEPISYSPSKKTEWMANNK